MNAWSEVGSAYNLNLKRKREEKEDIFYFGNFEQGVELEREMRETPHSLYDLWRSGGRNLSSQDIKFIYSMRATRGHRQHAISSRISCLEKKS